jgi:hypothetical protein
MPWGDLVVVHRHREDRRGHLADMNHDPPSSVGWSGGPDVVHQGVVASLIEKEVGGRLGGIIDRGSRHYDQLWGRSDDDRRQKESVAKQLRY